MRRLILKTLAPVPQLLDSSGQQVLGPSKQLALLVFLASQPHRRATREQVLAYLADRESVDPRASLRQLLYQLRQVSDTLVTGAEALTLQSDDLDYDVDVFRVHVAAGSFAQAADLYTADFFGSWLPRNAPEMEEWIERQRGILLAEWCSVLRRLIDLRMREGATDEALEWAELLAARSENDPQIQSLVVKLKGEQAANAARQQASPIQRARWKHDVRRFLVRAVAPIAVAGVMIFAVFSARGAMANATAEAGFVIVGWGNAEHPTDTTVFRATESGHVTPTPSSITVAALRTKRHLNQARTVRAYACSVGTSDSVTICFAPSWGQVSRLPGLVDAQMLGWIGDKAVLVRVGHRVANRFERRVVRVWALDGLMDTLKALGNDVNDAWPDRSGHFLVVSRHTAGGDEAILYDAERETMRPLPTCRLVGTDWSATMEYALACEHDLFIGRPDTPIIRRVPVQGRVVTGPAFSPNDSSIALVVQGRDARLLSFSRDGREESAVALPRTESTLLEWQPAADTSMPRLLLDEGFDSDSLDVERWRPFGMPASRVMQNRGIRDGAFFHNGDDRYESGIALRRRISLQRGITIEWWAQIPITAPLWQSVNITLCTAPPDSFYLRTGPAVSDGINNVIVWAEFPNPHGPSERQMIANLGGDSRSVTEALPTTLRDGRWHWYRLSLLQNGHAWLSADGALIAGPAIADLRRHREATLVIQGRSVGTTVLVDQVRVWEGARRPASP
jgi:DNA-binding SARP family transcriptional activator